MDLGPEQIRDIIIYVLILVVSVTFHEFGHAFVANLLGDDTPRRQGRVTINPVAHADPLGTLLLPLISAYVAATSGGAGGFGWGRPVETNPRNYSRRFTMDTGQVFVALAGPSMNVVLAVLVASVHVFLMSQGLVSNDLSRILLMAVAMNFTLFFFNLVPVPPLDGGWVMKRVSRGRFDSVFSTLATYGPFIIMALVVIPLLSKVFLVPARFCTTELYRGLALLAF